MNLTPSKNEVAIKPEVLAKAQAIVKTLDSTKQDSIVNLGLETQQKLSMFSNHMLEQVRSKDSGDVGETINSLLSQINYIDVDSLKPNPLANIPIIGPLISKMFNKGKEIVSKYQSVSTNIDDIVLKLDKSRLSLSKDNTVMESMFGKNLNYIHELEASIVAGKMKIDELKQEVASFSEQDGIEDFQIKDTVNYLDRLEKKVNDLQLTRTIAIQSLPQIRLIQANNQVLEEKIISSVHNTIPLWRNQIVIALAIQKQRKVLEIHQKVTQTTNNLLEKNSSLLKQNTIETAKANEEGIVDVQVLKKVNADLISTLDEIVKIKEEGKRSRQTAEAELVHIEEELKNKILTIKQGTSANEVKFIKNNEETTDFENV